MAQFDTFLDDGDVIAGFFMRYEPEFEGSWRDLVAQRVDSMRETETYRKLGAAATMREWVGNRAIQTANRYSMTLRNLIYEFSYEWTIDDMRRDQLGELRRILGDAGAKAAVHPEVLLTTLMINADTTTSGLCYDGQQFVDTDHSSGSSGTQTNDLTSTEIPSANVGTSTAPTPSEMANILSEAVGYQYGYLDDKGDPNVNGTAREFVVFCGTAQLYSAAVQAVGLSRLASGADNPLDGLKAQRQINITPKLNPRMSAMTAAIQIYRTDGSKPFLWQVEVPLTTRFIGGGSELEVRHRKHFFGADAVYSAGFNEWASAMEITLS